MAFTAGFSVSVGDPTKATDVSTLAANDDFLKTAVDKIMVDSATPTFALVDGVTATTQSAGNDSTKLATTAYADAAGASVGGSNTQVQYNSSGSLAGSSNLTFDGSVLALADGSASAPSLTNIDDANTGVLFPAADTFAITTGGTERVRVDSAGRMTNPTQPSFSCTTAQVNDCTGAGAAYTIPWSTEYFDVGSNFSGGVFTAPVTGKYFFSASIAMNNLTSAMDYSNLALVHSGETFNSSVFLNTYPIMADGGYATIAISAAYDLDASDTVHVTIQVSFGGADQVRVGADHACNFSGYLIG